MQPNHNKMQIYSPSLHKCFRSGWTAQKLWRGDDVYQQQALPGLKYTTVQQLTWTAHLD